jgi:RNA polymerase sigma-70 factor (ECF subfamily)
MNEQEQAIIRGLKNGENWAYKHIYDRHYLVLYNIAFTFLKDDFVAKTLVDDLIIHLYEKRESINITTSLRAYLVRSVRNSCLNHLRMKHEKQEINFSETDVSDDWMFSVSNTDAVENPLAILLEKELEQEITQAIERLPDECRAVFEKSRFEGKKHEMIAAELNISVNTVKYHIKNALLRLRKDLGKY